MKKIYFTILSVLALGNISIAQIQTSSDILQLTQNNSLGTARFNALSGAFGALGGDLTAVGENPAGSSVFLNSYGSITLGQGGGVSRANYFGNTTEETDATLDFNQIGGILILKNTTNSGFSKIALGLTYNKTNDFRDEYRFSSRQATNSIANYFVGQANGLQTGNLIRNGRTDRDALIDLNQDANAFRDQQAYIGFQSLLINPQVDQDSNTIYEENNVIGLLRSQTYNIKTGGSSGKVSFNFSGELQDKLLLGVNLNIHTVNKRKEISFIEENDFASFIYNIEQRTLGAGFSLNLGTIYKIEDNIRLGLSYESPTWLELNDEIDQSSNTNFNTPQNINNNSFSSLNIEPNLIFEYDSYQLRTPGTVSASIAYIIGKQGLLSAQYSRKDLSKTKYTSDGEVFDLLNNTIQNTFQAVNTYRLGGEYRYENWRLRGGLSKITSPYKNSRIAGDTNGFSLGTGYNWGKWKLDIAFNHIEQDRIETVFENNSFNNSANINKKDDAVTVTLGVNF